MVRCRQNNFWNLDAYVYEDFSLVEIGHKTGMLYKTKHFSMLYLIGTVVTQVLTVTDLLMHGAGTYVVETRTPLWVCPKEYKNYLTRVLMAKSKPIQQCVMQGTAYGGPKIEHFKRNKKLNQIRHSLQETSLNGLCDQYTKPIWNTHFISALRDTHPAPFFLFCLFTLITFTEECML